MPHGLSLRSACNMRISLVFLLVILLSGYAASEVSKCSSCAKGKPSADDRPTTESASTREKRQYSNGYYGSAYSNYYSYPQQYSYGTQQRSSCMMQSLLNHKIFCARKKRDVGTLASPEYLNII